jgi:glycosyltransferase involved in cell wall biosynthesis
MAREGSTGTRPLVLEVFEPPDGGVPEHVLLLATGLGQHGFDVEIVAPAGSQVQERAAEAGVTVHVIPFFRRDYRHPWDDARAVLAVRRVIAARRPALVHAHASKAGAIARTAAARTGVPAVYTPHCFGFVGEVSRVRELLVPPIERGLARLSAKIICVCQAELAIAREKRIGSPEQLVLLYYGVPDPSPAEAPVPDPALTALRDGGLLLANVSALRQQKRQDVLLDAARIVLDRSDRARVAVVGNGPLEGALREQAQRLGLDRDPRFVLLPFAPPVERYLGAIDVFVLASTWEALPISLLEAQSWGIPQIGTAVFGTPEIISTDTGRLVAPADAESLAAAMLELLDASTDLAAMADASRARHVERFALERMLTEHAALYRDVLGGA